MESFEGCISMSTYLEASFLLILVVLQWTAYALDPVE